MAYDGFCIRRIVNEYNTMLTDGKISKIQVINKYDVIFTVKKGSDTYNVFASANPSMAYTYITDKKVEAPKNALNFCMVLRKYIANGKIIKVTQDGNERIIAFYIEHMNEMGDKSIKKLVLELMGKHSNIILVDENGLVLDSIKRINSLMSSLREVLPGKEYRFPFDERKYNPYDDSLDLKDTLKKLFDKAKVEDNTKASAVFINSFEGVSKPFAKEVLTRCGLKDSSVSDLHSDDLNNISDNFISLINEIDNSNEVYLYSTGNEYKDFSMCSYKSLETYESSVRDNLVFTLFDYYGDKQKKNDVLQKAKDITHILESQLTRDKKKYSEWQDELKACENKDEARIKGELLKAYAYNLKPAKEVTVLNYYDNTDVKIELDETLSIIENSNKYFNEYQKQKRREEKLKTLIEEVEDNITFLEDNLLYISLSENSADLDEIRTSLAERGLIKKSAVKKKSVKGKYKHYVFMDNYHIFVGKNNIQNEELTFKTALGNDWWFHAKTVGGSHVIVKSDKDNPAEEWDMPDIVFEAAAAVAAANSKNSSSDKVEVDYTRKKHIKKPAEGKTGMVIYHTYYSMVASSDISSYELTMCTS
ncbi:MAG: NFACT family protein [Lachnospiraceae bacterium]|nr:NFACT family protein [Lachnospiraceae bacterium]